MFRFLSRWIVFGLLGIFTTACTGIGMVELDKTRAEQQTKSNWSMVNAGLYDTALFPIVALAIDPQTPRTIYAGGYGVFKSSNGGESWKQLNAERRGGSAYINNKTGVVVSTNSSVPNTPVTALVIDPQTPSTVYAGTSMGVFKTTNGGTSWDAVNTGLPVIQALALVIDPQVPSTVYVGGIGRYGEAVGIFKTMDGGLNWSAVMSGVQTRALVIDPLAPSTVYAATSQAVVKTTDGGATWNSADTGLPENRVLTLVIDPKVPSTLYAGMLGGVYKTTNGGTSWSTAYNGLVNEVLLAMNSGKTDVMVSRLAIDPQTPTTVYAGSGRHVYKSTNGGNTWNLVNTVLQKDSGMRSFTASALAVDPQDSDNVYAGMSEVGIYKSPNRKAK